MKENHQSNSSDLKILLSTLRLLRARAKEILWFLLIFLLLGFLFAFTNPKEWISSTELLPESQDQVPLSANLGGLASLAGIDLTSEAGLNPELYPNIANSTPFLLELASKKFKFQRLDSEMTLRDYLFDEKRRSISERIFAVGNSLKTLIGSSNQERSESLDYLVIGKKEETINKELKKRINVSVNKKSGVLRISVLMQDPMVAADIARFTEEYIINYVKDYYRQKAKLNLEFVESQLSEKIVEFESKQEEVAKLMDSNFGLATEISRIQIEKAQSERDLLFNVYSGLAQKYEEAKIRLAESTLVFKVIEPVTINYEKVEPKRFKILILMSFLGFFLGIIWVISSDYFKKELNV